MSICIESAVRSSRHFDDLVSFGDMRRFDTWCRTLGVTRNQLVVAIEEVGQDAGAVRTYLKRARR